MTMPVPKARKSRSSGLSQCLHVSMQVGRSVAVLRERSSCSQVVKRKEQEMNEKVSELGGRW